jgi:hypothetical protein
VSRRDRRRRGQGPSSHTAPVDLCACPNFRFARDSPVSVGHREIRRIQTFSSCICGGKKGQGNRRVKAARNSCGDRGGSGVPLATVIDVGDALMVKLGVVPVTVSETVVVSVVLPEVPVTVMRIRAGAVDEATVIVMVEVPPR